MKRIALLATVLGSLFFGLNVAQAYEAESLKRDIGRYKAEQLVELLYDGILFRSADYAGLDHYTWKVQRGGYQGLVQIAGELANSSEFRRKILKNYRPKLIVENLFRVFFNRHPEREGLRHYAHMVRRGQYVQAIKEIVDSREFRRKHLRRHH